MAIAVVSCDNPLVVSGLGVTPNHRYPGWPTVVERRMVGQSPVLDRLIRHPYLDTRIQVDEWDSPGYLYERKGPLGQNNVLNEQLKGSFICLDRQFQEDQYSLRDIDPSKWVIAYPQIMDMQFTFSGTFTKQVTPTYSWQYQCTVTSSAYNAGTLILVKTLNFESSGTVVVYRAEYWPDFLGVPSTINRWKQIEARDPHPVCDPFSVGFTTEDEQAGDEDILLLVNEQYLKSLESSERRGWSLQTHYRFNESTAWKMQSGSYVWRKPRTVYWSHLFPRHAINSAIKWNDLAAIAYNSLPFQNNGIAYVKDFVGMKEMAKSTGDLCFGLLQSRRLKAISQLYLSFHYGWKLQVMDTKEFISGLGSFLEESRLSASDAFRVSDDLRPFATYQVYYSPFEQLNSMLSKLFYYFDLSIDFSNLWDMTPWSFVVDWFFNIGDVLQTIDNYNSLIQRHRVKCVGQSIKASRKLKPRQVGLSTNTSVLSGEVNAIYYDRWYTTNPIPPSTTLTTSNSLTSAVQNHWIEGSTLFISNL